MSKARDTASTSSGSNSRGRNSDGELALRDAGDLKSLLLKIGVAVTFSFAGLLLSRLLLRPQPSPRLLPAPASVRGDDENGGVKTSGGLKEELEILKNEEAMAKIISGTSRTTMTTTTTTTTTTLVTSKTLGDEEGFLLPEFNDLVLNEFGQEPEITALVPAVKKGDTKGNTKLEQENAHLRSLVKSLQEKEKNLEMQLFEFYGMQEKEAAVRELENQVKINNVETKLYLLKIESLQSENQKLKAQISDYSKAVTELEAMRTQNKLLKKKLRSDAEQAKGKLVSLSQKISALQSLELKDEEGNAELEKRLKRLEELEDEARNLRVMNSKLNEENSDLMKRLEQAQNPITSLKNGAEVGEEVHHLKEENEKLTKDIERLQTDRFADVEELVYLRWINACLRYELRNYQPPEGKTARDLSKTLSPKSEEKAKQLIVEYANSGADHETSLSLIEFGSEYSSSHSTGEPEDTSVDISSAVKNSNSHKSKFFNKLRKLVLGKEKETHNTTADIPASFAYSERRASESSLSYEDIVGRKSNDSYSSCTTEEFIGSNQLSVIREQEGDQNFGRHSLDIRRIRRLSLDLGQEKGEHYEDKSMVSRDGRLSEFSRSSRRNSDEASIPEEAEIKKFAEVLKKSNSVTRSRRSASFSN